MCSGRTQELEEEQPTVEQELRRLMEKPGEDFWGWNWAECTTEEKENRALIWAWNMFVCAEHLKTSWDRKKEQQLMKKLVAIVNDRNAIVEGLDEDRLRCVQSMLCV